MFFQYSFDVSDIVWRRFPGHGRKLKTAFQSPSSIWKGEKFHLLIKVKWRFSLGTSESEADERYLSVTRFKNHSGIDYRFIEREGFYYVRSSRISLFSVDWSRSRLFVLLLVRISSDVTHSSSMPLCLCRIRVWDLNRSIGWSLILCQSVKGVWASLCYFKSRSRS